MIRLKILPLLFLLSCTRGWEKTESGIMVRLNRQDTGAVRTIAIDVVGDNIFHVRASPGERLSEEKSMIAVDDTIQGQPVFNVYSNKDYILVSSTQVSASVSLKSGRIIFSDQSGSEILSEPDSGGKSFTPVNIDNSEGHSLRQVFNSPDDEAFYGLGQHQSDEFNYKGLNESLYQYNTKVSVPFVVSNRNYGILWDNCSLTKFGDPREYSQIDIFRMFDDFGNQGGLTATYYFNSDPTRIYARRKEGSIDYEDLEKVKNFPENFPFNGSTITWSGEIEPPETGIFHFKLYYAGYVKLFIDNEEVVAERWRTSWNPNTYKFRKEMEQGRRYKIRVEWKPDGGISYIGLKALKQVSEEVQGQLSLSSEMGDEINYYFIKGDNIDQVISGYRKVTGKAPVMPRWAFGFWQSRERYRSQNELLDVLHEYRRRYIPLDNLVLDWSYWPEDAWGSHEFDPVHFPHPELMVNEVHRYNGHIMISVWPKFYKTTDHYLEFDRNGWIYSQAIRDSVRDWIGKGHIGSFYDAFNPDARKLFWQQLKEHLWVKGFDAWWMDASEPDILSNAGIEYRKKLMDPTALGPSAKYFNAYPLVNAMGIFEGQRAADAGRRVFILTRSGFPGIQRYSAATWSGDIGSRWEEMKAQIPAGLNYSLSGIPYWTFDIGGFSVEKRFAGAKQGSKDLEEWRELYTRWFQFGAFCPLFRSHGQYPFREIYNIAPENHPAYRSMVYYDRLRYRLIPYIYSIAGRTYLEDYTIMRALIMDFPEDKKVLNLGDQYMFGPSILVAPVYNYKATSREVYLPAGCGWYNMVTGRFSEGGQTINASAPYERIPLFIREGSIIPLGREIQHTGEEQNDLDLLVYTGKDAVFTLYEDEGTNYNYERGAYSNIRISYNQDRNELKIGRRTGEFPGMPERRKFSITWIDRENKVSVPYGYKPDAVVNYKGDEVIVKRLPRNK